MIITKKLLSSLLTIVISTGIILGFQQSITVKAANTFEKTIEKPLKLNLTTTPGNKSEYYINTTDKNNLPTSEYNKKIDIQCAYGIENKLKLQFSNLGVNQTTQLTGVKILDKNDNLIEDRSYDIETDWVSPYGIKENNITNPNLSSQPITVGGNHGSNKALGYPTSKRESLKIEVDGEPISADQLKNKSANEVKIITSNKILPSNYNFSIKPNEKDYAVRETVEYVITEGNIQIHVNLQPLKSNLQLTNYAGLQATTKNYDTLQFMKSENNTEYDMKNNVDINLDKNNNVVDRFILNNKSDDLLIGYIDRGYKLGNLEYAANGWANVKFMTESKKVYLKNICTSISKCPTIKDDGSISYRGGYTFTPKIRVGKNSIFYPLKIDGKTIYTVDTKGKDTISIPMDNKLVGKKIKIEDTTSKNTFVTDGIITPEGLIVDSSKAGQLQFTIDESVDNTLEVKNEGNKTEVAFKYDKNNDMVLTFEPFGPNKLTQMVNVKKVKNSDIKASTSSSIIADNYSLKNEWISPYVIRSKSADPNKPTFTVGGNSAYNTKPTAKHSNLTIKIDDKDFLTNAKTNSKIGHGEKVTVTVENEIAPCTDTDKLNNPVNANVIETVTYTITKNKVDIDVNLESTKPVFISKYAGLVCKKMIFTEAGFYNKKTVENPEPTLWFPTTTDADNSNMEIGSGNKNQNKISSFGLRNDTDTIIGYIDRNVGIGNLDYLNDTNQVALFKNNTLSMYNISNIVELSLETNNIQSINYSGGYIFNSNK